MAKAFKHCFKLHFHPPHWDTMISLHLYDHYSYYTGSMEGPLRGHFRLLDWVSPLGNEYYSQICSQK